MKFEELKKCLKQRIESRYLIKGRDIYLQKRAVGLIESMAEIELPELNTIKISDLDIDCDNVVAALNTPPVMSDRKMVYMDVSLKGIKLRNVDTLAKYLSGNNDTSILVINIGDMEELPKGIDFCTFCIVDCNELSNDVAIKLLELEAKKLDKTITSSAARLILEYTNYDLMTSINEISKLANYCTDKISEDDVSAMVPKTPVYKIYELTEALAYKKMDKVYEILGDLKSKKGGYTGLLALIYSHFRRLLHMSIAKLTVAEYANLFGIKEYAVTKSMQQLKLFKPKKLKEICDLCIALDYKIKTSQTTPNNAIDMIVMIITS